MKTRLFLLLLLPTLYFSACNRSTASRSSFVLGTICTINAFDDGTDALYDAVFLRLRQIEDVFSVNKDGTALAAIHAASGEHAVPASDEVLFVLQNALHFCALTDGAFDISIGPLVKLWGISTEHARVPAQTEIDAALPLVDWRNIIISAQNKTVYAEKKGMQLDVGGIAKGYAADEVASILRAHKVRRAIIDLGGNIVVFGKKADGSPWRVGIKNPEHAEGSPVIALSVEKGSVVTSGVYERFFEQDGIRYHHILDTKTGRPVQNGLLSVTVVCDSSLQADALSTGLFALGLEEGRAFAEQQGIPAIFIDDAHAVWATTAASNTLELLSNDYVRAF